ncbi:MAG: glutamine-hydrolyzing carbamoyl-phosphate synthase small subunit [Saprospiraceae bacterium]|nr:glutamine-hydrolyzing carbamoyl-phosphate synthase small subunit [Saprospiraceae bacterium]
MTPTPAPRAVLLLEDGTVFYGRPAGKIGTTLGEICFNTGMTGYQEIFTDPSYFGQIMVMTNVHVGNYGIKLNEVESNDIKISGLVTREYTVEYSRQVADTDIQNYLETEGLVAITGVDTRALVRHIRSKGAMNAIISSEITDLEILKERLTGAPSMEGLELASKVCTTEPYYLGDPNASFKVAVLDFGVKKSILSNLTTRNCYLKVFPARTAFSKIASWDPDAFFLSNGPGDPAAMDYATELAREILKDGRPVFGICLGHQVLARALGVNTYKMHHGHRGINHPVLNLETGLSEITSQNHGFGVDPESIKANSESVMATHVNLNDGTVEGLKALQYNAFSVQYHPEASPGPHDSRYLFDQFLEKIKATKQQQAAVS